MVNAPPRGIKNIIEYYEYKYSLVYIIGTPALQSHVGGDASRVVIVS